MNITIFFVGCYKLSKTGKSGDLVIKNVSANILILMKEYAITHSKLPPEGFCRIDHVRNDVKYVMGM